MDVYDFSFKFLYKMWCYDLHKSSENHKVGIESTDLVVNGFLLFFQRAVSGAGKGMSWNRIFGCEEEPFGVRVIAQNSRYAITCLILYKTLEV